MKRSYGPVTNLPQSITSTMAEIGESMMRRIQPNLTIPFGYKQVFGQLEKGDGVWDGQRFARVKKTYPFVGLTRLVAIRRCEVAQAEIPGTEAPLNLDE